MRNLIFVIASIAALITASHAMAAQVPGPSQALFKSPYYACHKNYYVSSTGSDNNPGTAPASAWATLQHANDSMPTGGAAAGTCINVVASGTAYAGVALSTGGNLAASTGYLVYRCTTLLGCTINADAGANGNAGFIAIGTGVANFVIIDGFRIRGNRTVYNVGYEINAVYGAQPGVFSSHHDWVLNSAIYDNGQAGIGTSNGDYFYAIHNWVFDNASAPSCDNGAQGSGIGNNVAIDISKQYPHYVPTADDKANPNPLIGSFTKSDGSFFHNVYMWNGVFNNHLTPCDANGGDGW
jgi:hypothetical protein